MRENGDSGGRFEIGRALERARERRGLSIDEAERATKIRARYLEELERGNFDVLPPVYAQGSLRTYANYLGLDAPVLVSQLQRGEGRSEVSAPAGRVATKEEDPAGAVPAASGGATDDGERETSQGEEAGLRAWIPSGDEIRSYLGMVALVVIVLPLVVLALTLVDRDLTPSPKNAPGAEQKASKSEGGAGKANKEEERPRARLASQTQERDEGAKARDEGNGSQPEQGERRGGERRGGERRGGQGDTAAGAPSDPAPSAADGSAAVPASAPSTAPASAPAASTAPATASPATAAPEAASPGVAPAATAPAAAPSSTAAPAAPVAGSTPPAPAAAQPAAEPGGTGLTPSGGAPDGGFLGADPAPEIPNLSERVNPSVQRAAP